MHLKTNFCSKGFVRRTLSLFNRVLYICLRNILNKAFSLKNGYFRRFQSVLIVCNISSELKMFNMLKVLCNKVLCYKVTSCLKLSYI